MNISITGIIDIPFNHEIFFFLFFNVFSSTFFLYVYYDKIHIIRFISHCSKYGICYKMMIMPSKKILDQCLNIILHNNLILFKQIFFIKYNQSEIFVLYLNILACGFFLLGVSGIYFLDYFLFYIFVNGRKTGGKRYIEGPDEKCTWKIYISQNE